MWQTVKKFWQAQAAIILFLILTWWWYVQVPKSPRFFGDFPSIYGVMALWGAIWGIIISKKWGGASSVMGKAIRGVCIVGFSWGWAFWEQSPCHLVSMRRDAVEGTAPAGRLLVRMFRGTNIMFTRTPILVGGFSFLRIRLKS